MEHLHEFGLGRDPFANDPLPQFHFASAEHDAAERRVRRAATQGRGLCLLTGEPGVGKSVVARRVLESLEEDAFEAGLLLIMRGDADERWLLSRIARQLGAEDVPEEPLAQLATCYDLLAAFREEGRRPVVIIDRAHALAQPVLMEALRALLELEYEEQHLLTLVLVGSEALDGVVGLDPDLARRVEIRVPLRALDAETSRAYVAHRLKAAGGDPAVLAADAMERLVALGAGSPRRINALGDNALFEAHLAGRNQVAAADVLRAARMLGMMEPPATPSPGETLPAPAPAHSFDPKPEPMSQPADEGRRAEPELDDALELTEPADGFSPELAPEVAPAAAAAAQREAARTLIQEFEAEPEEAAVFEEVEEDQPVLVAESLSGDAVEADVENLFEELIEED